MKRQNRFNTKKLLIGLNFGDHTVNPETIVEEIRKEVVGKADAFILRCKPFNPLPSETYVEIARFAKEENLFFAILYANQHPPKGRRSHLDKETVAKINEVAGELFLGEAFAETGSQSVAHDEGYYADVDLSHEQLVKPPQDFKNMHEARQHYVNYIRSMLEYNKEIGIQNSIMVEPTAIGAYDLEGGISTLMLEMFPADSEKIISFTRGASIGYNRDSWGGFVAHEYYGGYEHNDALKIKRLDLAYKYLYMQGSNYIFLESGHTEIESYAEKYEYDSPVCQRYRNFSENFHRFAEENPRPACGPYTKVAFVFGEDDGHAEFLGSSTWCQFGREEWAHSEREKSWKILNEVYRTTNWHEMENYAFDGVDLSNAPAYGTYDVIPASTPLEIMQNYDYLIFVGHNTMSAPLYEKLTAYVQNGGVLLACASHLRTTSERNFENTFYNDGDFSQLFGAKIVDTVNLNHGMKFYPDSYVPNMKYPSSIDVGGDANYPSGHVDIAVLETTGARICAKTCRTFRRPADYEPALITEYKNGKGVAILLSYTHYPANPAVYPIYKIAVKALLNASHANAKIQVFGSDRVRFSVFFDESGNKTLYLLNTQFDAPACVGVRYEGKTQYVTVGACELKTISLDA